MPTIPGTREGDLLLLEEELEILEARLVTAERLQVPKSISKLKARIESKKRNIEIVRTCEGYDD